MVKITQILLIVVMELCLVLGWYSPPNMQWNMAPRYTQPPSGCYQPQPTFYQPMPSYQQPMYQAQAYNYNPYQSNFNMRPRYW